MSKGEAGGSDSLRIFIGFDERQPVSYTVLQHSILTRASRPVALTPLVLKTLPITRQGLTPFTYSRFLVPWLCGFQGWALFLDLDMLVLGDVAELFGYADDSKAVVVCTEQRRFEWASAMLFNCAHSANRVLTPDYVDDPQRCQAPHGIDWVGDAGLIGSFPPEWNHCIGYNPPRPAAKLAHYTMGIPAFPEVKGCEYSDEWHAEFRAASSTRTWATLMAHSVHACKLPDGRVLPKLHPEARRYMASLAKAQPAKS